MLFFSTIETEEERDLCEALYLNYRSDIFRYARTFFRQDCDAEDIVQTVFCEVAAKYIKKLQCMEEPSRKRFLMLITKYRALRQKKELDRCVSLDSPLTDTGFVREIESDVDFVDEICRRSEYEQLRAAIFKLDADDRAVLWLRFYCGFKTGEIAQMLAEKPASVTKRLQRTKKKLASMIGEEGGAA